MQMRKPREKRCPAWLDSRHSLAGSSAEDVTWEDVWLWRSDTNAICDLTTSRQNTSLTSHNTRTKCSKRRTLLLFYLHFTFISHSV